MNEVIKEYIDTYVKENGNEEITGAILNSTLNKMVSQLYAHRCCGVITPYLPLLYGTDIPAWGIASQNGTYTNYGCIEVEDELALIVYDGTTFTKQTIISKSWINGPASSVENSIPVFDGITGKLLKVSSVVVNGDNMKPQLVTFKAPSELIGTNAMDFNLNQNWIVYLSGATTTITMTPITASPVFTCNIEVVQDAIGGCDLVLVDVDGKAVVNTQEFDFASGGANQRCFITIKYWVTGYRFLVDNYI